MRAWTFRTRGPPSVVLKLETDLSKPSSPTRSNLLIKVSHSALTPGISHAIKVFPSLPLLSRPYIPELDFSGIIELAGPDAPAEFTPGTRAFGSVPISTFLLHGTGTLAEYVMLPAIHVLQMPQTTAFGFAEAASLDGNGQTAALMVRTAGIKKGSRVFVNGGSGGVGTLALQIAKAEGAYVVATGAGENFDLVKKLGADEVIDYRVHAPLHTYLSEKYGSEPFDVILDTIGTDELFQNSPGFLKADGKFVNVGAMEGIVKGLWCAAKNSLWPRLLGGTPRTYIFQQTNPDQKTRQYLAKLIEEDKLIVAVDKVYEMEDALQAYERMASQRAKGKVVVKVQNI
ncbi:NAD(P)-binding protein [Microthyrium microscopicum]|uniref:NAD(P)-binding protein n=1 Tax=Microthyrium microscopicum TaxID=703497 RepID=A0A6A6UIE4_9PEZI|nr:NAD(P)-binding protein [Microthyrium microscopicum]